MSVFTLLASSKIAASAAAVGALAVGGVGTAAYTGSLPTDAQQVAHQVIGAPAPKPVQDAQDAATAAAQNAKGQATQAAGTATKAAADAGQAAAQQAIPASGAADLDVVGLCHANAQGTLDAASGGFKSLSLAANGEANIAAFCQTNGASASVQGSAGANSAAQGAVPSLPSLPAVPGQNALPSAPAVPSSIPAVPATAPAVPSNVTNAVRP